MNSFFDSEFNYCPLLWMSHILKNNTKINNVHEWCLRLIYSDKRSSYEELLEKIGSVSIQHRNIEVLATEIYKVKNDLSPKIFSDLFYQTEMNPHSLRIQHDFEVPLVKDYVSLEWKYLISWSKDMRHSPGINKGSKFVKQF